MEHKIDIAARRQVTNKQKTQYSKTLKVDKGTLSDRVENLCLPLLAETDKLDQSFATEQARSDLQATSVATVDRYLRPVRERMRLPGQARCLNRSRTSKQLQAEPTIPTPTAEMLKTLRH